jgi:uncharacterized protein
MHQSLNVLGGHLKSCCNEPVTGFYRNGFCSTGPDDHGKHIICVSMTKEFLAFSKARGNDLSTPHPEWGFPGLVAGDRWCLCAARWLEALEAGVTPPKVDLEATHEEMLTWVPLLTLKEHALE